MLERIVGGTTKLQKSPCGFCGFLKPRGEPILQKGVAIYRFES